MKRGYKYILWIGAIILLFVICVKGIVFIDSPIQFCEKEHVEEAHGIRLPSSSRAFQQGSGGIRFLDRGVVSMFEMNATDLRNFLSSLRIKSRYKPVHLQGNPIVEGSHVWPNGTDTFIPGGVVDNSFKQTWVGEAKPIEMFSCDSPTGDWLHAEVWRVTDDDLVIIKLYTDWN